MRLGILAALGFESVQIRLHAGIVPLSVPLNLHAIIDFNHIDPNSQGPVRIRTPACSMTQHAAPKLVTFNIQIPKAPMDPYFRLGGFGLVRSRI